MVNVSEGRDTGILGRLSAAAGSALLDLHRDPDHHRSVFTLAGENSEVDEAVKALAAACVACLDLGAHDGVHPRTGVLDVVPFVPYRPGGPPEHDLGPAVLHRDEFARWLSASFAIPTFLYGPLTGDGNRTLPQLRRHAFGDIPPDFGPRHPHPSAGATMVGARSALVAYNVWVSSVAVARRVAPLLRGPAVRALGLSLGDRAQVSCNLVDPLAVGPAQLFDMVVTLAKEAGGAVQGAELVGLVPQSVLRAVPSARWAELDLSIDKTIEARLEG